MRASEKLWRRSCQGGPAKLQQSWQSMLAGVTFTDLVRCKSTRKLALTGFIWTKQTSPYKQGYIYAVKRYWGASLLRVHRSN